MSIEGYIADGFGGTKNKAKVTTRGQLVVAPLEFSIASSAVMTLTGTAYSLAIPATGKQGVITDIIISGNKDLGVNGSLVEIYLADSITSTTSAGEVLTTQIAKNGSLSLTNLNWIYTAGKWLNAKCDSSTVYVTAAGYYIDV